MPIFRGEKSTKFMEEEQDDFRALKEAGTPKVSKKDQKSLNILESRLRVLLATSVFAGFFGGPLSKSSGEMGSPGPEVARGESSSQKEFALRTRLERLFGKNLFNALKSIDEGYSPDALLMSVDPEPAEARISGFENLGISNNVMRDIIYETFPKEWLQSGLLEFKYKDEDLKLPAAYGEKPRPAIALCSNREGRGAATVTYGREAKAQDLEQLFDRDVVHELAHVFDPLGHDSLPMLKRLQFLERLLNRVKSKSRYRPGTPDYVDSIVNKDRRIQLFNRATEYWAVIFEEFFSEPYRAMTTLPDEDRSLIEDYLLETAPSFDPFPAVAKRRKLLEDAIAHK